MAEIPPTMTIVYAPIFDAPAGFAWNEQPEIGDDPEDEPWTCGLCGFTTQDWMLLQRHWSQHEVSIPPAALEWAQP